MVGNVKGLFYHLKGILSRGRKESRVKRVDGGLGWGGGARREKESDV